ncbi:hypothetical protein N7481_004070 [Penicillium waksmanii]|uniref:uncharacterized protein n=1 Tax=Penicillium waksmanii TaxID=69791 RepID=UPI002546CA67|nr:uncharacterized protein N7481_004070 [Penicillium waksmanii]KAJ5988860.1 hypothetical protein N7481_004070 [Penicillium waksmanii]
MPCPLLQLPNELLHHIITILAPEPPSRAQLYLTPNLHLVRSEQDKNLKHLALTSSQFLDLVRPILFSHACLELKDEPDFRTFLVRSNLNRYVTSLVAISPPTPVYPDDPSWWRRVLRYLDPDRIALLAPPVFIGETLNASVQGGFNWAFEIDLQILQLERDACPSRDLSSLQNLEYCTNLLTARPWTSIAFNESSSLKAYHHYEYFLGRVPSFVGEWGVSPPATGTLAGCRPRTPGCAGFDDDIRELCLLLLCRSLPVLQPYGAHIKYHFQNGQSAPTDYSVGPPMSTTTLLNWSNVVHSIQMTLGWNWRVRWHIDQHPSIVEFRSRDLHVEAVREDLIRVLQDNMGTKWTYDGIMALASNAYSAEPAFPILAHSLLSQPRSPTPPSAPLHVSADSNDWGLKRHWDEGIQSSQSTIFKCGTIIGFSRLRSRDKNNDDYVAQIPRHLLIKSLSENPASSEPRAFIIFPRGFEAFAPRTLLGVLQSSPTEPKLSREEAIKRLDTVQLLPVHNLPNAAQAIGQVSGSLQKIERSRQQQADNTRNSQPVILIVVGLDTLAEGVIRASNPVRGTALLSATLRNLNRMSRAHAPYLSTILVNTNGIGPAAFESTHQQGPNLIKLQDEDTRPSWDDGIHSVFQTPGSTLLSTLLMKTLDQGIDTHILISDIKTSQVAEVIKSRVGPGLGKWSVWTPST